MKNRTIILILTVVFFAFKGNGLAETHQRDSWYIGFGLGGAFGASCEYAGQEITFDDWLAGTDKSPKISLNFKVGKTLSPKTLIGFDLTAVSQTGSLGGIDGHIQINNYFFMFTHLPKEEGFAPDSQDLKERFPWKFIETVTTAISAAIWFSTSSSSNFAHITKSN